MQKSTANVGVRDVLLTAAEPGGRPAAERCPAGTGKLEVLRRGTRSIVTRAYAASPLRLLTPRNHGAAAWIYAATYGGGLVGGDAVQIDLAVGEGAVAMLSTQAATKVYRSTHGASARLTARVSAAGLLAILPDPVVCFAHSTYRQDQSIDLESGAGLVLVDWLSSGRHAAGERWRFDKYSSRLVVRQDGRIAILDALLLDAHDSDPATRMGRFNVLCLVVLIGPHVVTDATRILSQIGAMPVGRRASLVMGASAIGESGCMLRIAGVSLDEVAGFVRTSLRFVPVLLGDDPWARKW